MSIGNMPEDELDELFRQAASGYHPEFDPEAWRAMEKKLDVRAGASPKKWWRPGGLVLLLLITGFGSWLGYNSLNQQKEDSGKATKQVIITNQKTNQPNADLDFKGGLTPEVDKKETVSVKVASAAGKVTKPGLKPEPFRISANRVNKLVLDKPAGYQNRFGSGTASGTIPASGGNDRQDFTETEATGATEVAPPGTAAIMASKPEEKSSLTFVDPAASQPKRPATALLIDSTATDSNVAVTDSAVDNISKKLLSLNRFTFSLLVAPDLSTVGFANPGGISTNAGVTISYNLNRKWSLSTGLIKARKIYDAKPDDYGNSYYWYNQPKPTDISAICQVLDIPLNIGYNLWQKEKSGLTVQTGLSSYLMLEEEYTYQYASYYGGTGYSKYYEVKNKNHHVFSIYNLSGRYARLLAPGVTAGVEPFVKIPLAGVGAGKVKLASAGVFFSVSYRYPQ